MLSAHVPWRISISWSPQTKMAQCLFLFTVSLNIFLWQPCMFLTRSNLQLVLLINVLFLQPKLCICRKCKHFFYMLISQLKCDYWLRAVDLKWKSLLKSACQFWSEILYHRFILLRNGTEERAYEVGSASLRSLVFCGELFHLWFYSSQSVQSKVFHLVFDVCNEF